ncbi:MAG: hypothetical protein DI530_06760 [Sphingomonas sp.]|nr:MAG: hypothetical protein DI530_06760 [Sphingomonas sp.]
MGFSVQPGWMAHMAAKERLQADHVAALPAIAQEAGMIAFPSAHRAALAPVTGCRAGALAPSA